MKCCNSSSSVQKQIHYMLDNVLPMFKLLGKRRNVDIRKLYETKNKRSMHDGV